MAASGNEEDWQRVYPFPRILQSHVSPDHIVKRAVKKTPEDAESGAENPAHGPDPEQDHELEHTKLRVSKTKNLALANAEIRDKRNSKLDDASQTSPSSPRGPAAKKNKSSAVLDPAGGKDVEEPFVPEEQPVPAPPTGRPSEKGKGKERVVNQKKQTSGPDHDEQNDDDDHTEHTSDGVDLGAIGRGSKSVVKEPGKVAMRATTQPAPKRYKTWAPAPTPGSISEEGEYLFNKRPAEQVKPETTEEEDFDMSKTSKRGAVVSPHDDQEHILPSQRHDEEEGHTLPLQRSPHDDQHASQKFSNARPGSRTGPGSRVGKLPKPTTPATQKASPFSTELFHRDREESADVDDHVVPISQLLKKPAKKNDSVFASEPEPVVDGMLL